MSKIFKIEGLRYNRCLTVVHGSVIDSFRGNLVYNVVTEIDALHNMSHFWGGHSVRPVCSLQNTEAGKHSINTL